MSEGKERMPDKLCAKREGEAAAKKVLMANRQKRG